MPLRFEPMSTRSSTHWIPETRPVEDAELYVLESRDTETVQELFATRRRLPHFMPDNLAVMLTIAQRGALPKQMLERVRSDYEMALSKTKNAEPHTRGGPIGNKACQRCY